MEHQLCLLMPRLTNLGSYLLASLQNMDVQFMLLRELDQENVQLFLYSKITRFLECMFLYCSVPVSRVYLPDPIPCSTWTHSPLNFNLQIYHPLENHLPSSTRSPKQLRCTLINPFNIFALSFSTSLQVIMSL